MSAPISMWLSEPISDDVAQSLRRLSMAAGALHVAAMPDVHLSKDVCVGVAFATENQLYPAAVGGDIGCGMAALAFDASADVLATEERAARVLTALYESVPALKQRRPNALPISLLRSPLSSPELERAKGRDGTYQLGTLGRGNHFIELQADEQDRLWLMVHTGSRGMGGKIRDVHVRHATTDAGSRLAYLDAESDAGKAYLADQLWALDYAQENRARIVQAVSAGLARALGIRSIDDTLITCHHNHVRREETMYGRALVHRKGAIYAGDGVAGIIPGSMGTRSHHTLGRGCTSALCSSSHGAGRRMSRTEARKTIGVKTLTREMRGVWFDHRRANALRDEAPGTYKDIGGVMRKQKELTRVVRTLRPLLAFKY